MSTPGPATPSSSSTPSLSTSTLNLKFMQRAAARNAQTATPVSKISTPRSGPESSTPNSLDQSTSTPLAQSSTVPLTPNPNTEFTSLGVGFQAEQEASARWIIPRPPTSNSTIRDEGRVTFESSYLPFLMGIESESEAGPSRLGRTSGGGGRMAFGGFGEQAKEEPEEEDEGEEGEGDGEQVRVKKGKGSEKEKSRRGDRDDDGGGKRSAYKARPKPQQPQPQQHTSSSGFIRPSNYTSDLPHPSSTSTVPSTSAHPKSSQNEDTKPIIPGSGHKRKPSTAADQFRTISSQSASELIPKKEKGNKNTQVTVEHAAGGAGIKRAKLDLSTSTSSSSPLPSAAGDLDAREREIKAQKKRDKKAKRKLKAEGGDVV